MRGTRPRHTGRVGPVPVVVPVPIFTPPAAGAHSGGGGGVTPIPLSHRRRLPFSPAFRFPHFVSPPPPSTPRAVARSGGGGYWVVPVVLFPSSWFAGPSSSPSPGPRRRRLPPRCRRGFVGMAPLPQQLATVGCWWPWSLSLPRHPFLSLPVCPCHRPSLFWSIIHPASRCSQRWRVGVLSWHRLMVNNIDRT